MKKLLLLVPLISLMACSRSMQMHTYPANDNHIQIMGRHLIGKKGAVKFGASGVTFFMKFKGTSLAVDLQGQPRDSAHYNWFDVTVDGGKVHEFRTKKGKQHYVLAKGLKPGVHKVVLCKATEGQNGHNTLVSIQTQKLLQVAPLPKRKIEYIGDSITCGFGDDTLKFDCNKGHWFDHTNSWYAYGPRLSRHLHAQWMLSSVSGIGMYRNWNDPGPTMPDVYSGVYMQYTKHPVKWNYHNYVPNLVFIALGTNDFSKGPGKKPRPKLNGNDFVKAYTKFVARVHKEYPKAKFILANSPMFGSKNKKILSGYLKRVIKNSKAAGIKNITYFTWGKTYNHGCDSHPYMNQQAKMSKQLVPFVSKFMGWKQS